MKLLGIKLEYIQKHTPEDNGDVESFHNSIKTDYIWPNQFMDFRDASIAIGKAFCDYNECRLYSSIDYLPPREFRDEAKQPLASLIQNSRYYHTSNQKILKIR